MKNDIFSDESKWVIRRSVPVFAEHDNWDYFALLEIAENTNKREKQTGDACPIMIGHTTSEKETELGDIVGYARNFRVGRFGADNRLGILADFYFLPNKYALAMEFPRRSVELWVEEKVIDPIALLKRTPKLDLGLLTHYSKSGKVYKYQLSNEHERAHTMEEKLDSILSMLAKLVARLDSGDTENKQEYKCGPETEKMQYAKEQATETTTVQSVEKTAPSKESDDKSSWEQERIQFARQLSEQSARLAKMEQEAKALMVAYKRAERERDIIQLEAEGYILDRMGELELGMSLDDNSWKKHVERIRKWYQRSPGASNAIPVAHEVPRFTIDENKLEQILEKVRAGKSYDEAVKQ